MQSKLGVRDIVEGGGASGCDNKEIEGENLWWKDSI